MFPVISAEEAGKKIVEYYKQSRSQYKILWSTREALAFHMGFWDENSHSLNDALLNENKFLAEAARISKNDLVLDAGCGIGGSAIWIAKNIGARVIGIANEGGLIQEAQRNAIKNHVEDRVSFELLDYNHTIFPNNTFDVVWAIESFDYAPDKKALFEEVRRILKRGGAFSCGRFFSESQN